MARTKVTYPEQFAFAMTTEMLEELRAAATGDLSVADLVREAVRACPPGEAAARLRAGATGQLDCKAAARLLIRLAAALALAKGGGIPDPRDPGDVAVLAAAVASVGAEFDDHDMWAAGLVPGEVHWPRCRRWPCYSDTSAPAAGEGPRTRKEST